MAEINLSEYLKELGLKLNDKKITERISRVASKLKINLSPSFDREELLALPNDALENLSLKLMTTKCQYLVRDQNEFLNVMTPLFYGLLTPRLKALDLTGYMTFCKDEKKFDSFRTAIFGIYFCAKNIKKLQILNDGDAFSQFAIDELLRDTLKGFKNLRKLDIDFFTFNLEDVMNICHKVPTLKYINSNFKFEEIPSEQDLKKKLANLKGFQFKLVGQHDWKALIKRCMYYVRNLQVIGTPYIPFCTTYKIDDWTPLRTSNLRYMGIDNSLDWENYFPIMYSYVQNLSIDWNVWNEPSDYPLRKFEGIKTLTLLNIPVDSVIRLLIVHGIHLLELYVTVDASSLPPLTYSRIFELCPRLQKIYLHDIHNQSETIESFANINELKLDLDTLENSNILNAPDLQKVQLIGVGRSTKSYDSLVNSMHERTILQNLEYLSIDLRWDHVEKIQPDPFRDMSFLVKTVNVFLPKIAIIKLYLNHQCDYLKLANTLKDSKSTDEEVQKLLCKGVSVKSLAWIIVDYLLISILENHDE